jgi:riboflavin kinase/FMN adenylyltransferase
MPHILSSLTGEVVRGNEKGRTVGMPTANVQIDVTKPLPAFGVYATIVHIDGNQYYGVTNVGWRPSVEWSRKITVETFIMDFSGDLYGKTITVDFYKYLRDTIMFDSIEEVKRQVMKDCGAARTIFNSLLLCLLI